MVRREALKLNEILRNAPKAVDMDLPHQREAGEHAEDMTSKPKGVTFEEAYAVDGLWATPHTLGPRRVGSCEAQRKTPRGKRVGIRRKTTYGRRREQDHR